MNFDEMMDGFASGDDDDALDALECLIEEWDAHAEACRALLAAYVGGANTSERAERALFYVLHAFGDMEDTAAHTDICRLVVDGERANLVLGEDAVAQTLPGILINTFDGDPASLRRVVDGCSDDILAGYGLLALAYLARTRALPEGWMAAYLGSLQERPTPEGESFLWFAWVKAVSALGLAGFAPHAERMFRAGHVDPDLADSKSFWQDLRAAMADPDDMSDFAWTLVGPFGDAVDEITDLGGLEDFTESPETERPVFDPPVVLQPMHEAGRNDPCPCGSGKKYKKCCLGGG